MRKSAGVASRPAPSGHTIVLGYAPEAESDLRFSDPVMVNGPVKGDVGSDATVTVALKGIVYGSIRAANIDVHGVVRGSVTATDRIQLFPSARVFGDVEAPAIEIGVGAMFEGKCRMTG